MGTHQPPALTEGVYYILLSLCGGPLHGYGIMQNTQSLTGGRVNLGPGTLYGAINILLEKQWILAVPVPADSRKKEYAITPAGREALSAELARLQELVAHGEKLVEEGQA